MNWVWFIGGTWIAVGIALALLIGRSIHLANLKAADAVRADVPLSALMPASAAAPAIERRTAPIRQNQSSVATTRSPFIGGCVSPAERVPAEHEHGVL